MMGINNYGIIPLQTPKLLFHLISFILLSIPLATPLSFNFTRFNPNDNNITYERAYPENQVIQLTKSMGSMGRATYRDPMHLWDNATGNLTDFTTQFTFVIDSQGRSGYGDGIAFFLAPVGSRIPSNSTKGASLGLTSDGQFLNSTDNPFVAVEFDIYQNAWDRNGSHVGIDINSMKSVKDVTWRSSIENGSKNDAWVSYNSSTKNLSIAFTGFRNNTIVQQRLYYTIDLRRYLPESVTFGFTAATGNASAIHSIHSWSFSSSLYIDENMPIPGSNRRSKRGLAAGLGVGGGCLLGLVLFGFWIKMRKRQENAEDTIIDEIMDDEFEKGIGPKKFSYNELVQATSNFDEQEKLGEGGFGGVYRGFMKDLNTYVAVKRISKGSKQGIKEYASEVRIIGRVRHRNLVQLIGWCHQKGQLLLVYEFMPNGSLASHLFKPQSLLVWEARYRIAQGLASGLLYLHEEWEQCVVHRDIKASNVMLDSNFNAKLGDFGLARLVDHGKDSQTTVLAGTMGYMAPESVTFGRASKETDVYSFGIVALEIACGRRPVDQNAEESRISMVEWVWELYGRGMILEAADPRLCGDFDGQQMKRLMIVGLWCAHPDYNSRPSVRLAIQVLNFEVPLPTLQSQMPVLTYFAPPGNPFSSSSLSNSKGTGAFEIGQTHTSSHSYTTNSSHFTTSPATASVSRSLMHTR